MSTPKVIHYDGLYWHKDNNDTYELYKEFQAKTARIVRRQNYDIAARRYVTQCDRRYRESVIDMQCNFWRTFSEIEDFEEFCKTAKRAVKNTRQDRRKNIIKRVIMLNLKCRPEGWLSIFQKTPKCLRKLLNTTRMWPLYNRCPINNERYVVRCDNMPETRFVFNLSESYCQNYTQFLQKTDDPIPVKLREKIQRQDKELAADIAKRKFIASLPRAVRNGKTLLDFSLPENQSTSERSYMDRLRDVVIATRTDEPAITQLCRQMSRVRFERDFDWTSVATWEITHKRRIDDGVDFEIRKKKREDVPENQSVDEDTNWAYMDIMFFEVDDYYDADEEIEYEDPVVAVDEQGNVHIVTMFIHEYEGVNSVSSTPPDSPPPSRPSSPANDVTEFNHDEQEYPSWLDDIQDPNIPENQGMPEDQGFFDKLRAIRDSWNKVDKATEEVGKTAANINSVMDSIKNMFKVCFDGVKDVANILAKLTPIALAVYQLYLLNWDFAIGWPSIVMAFAGVISMFGDSILTSIQGCLASICAFFRKCKKKEEVPENHGAEEEEKALTIPTKAFKYLGKIVFAFLSGADDVVKIFNTTGRKLKGTWETVHYGGKLYEIARDNFIWGVNWAHKKLFGTPLPTLENKFDEKFDSWRDTVLAYAGIEERDKLVINEERQKEIEELYLDSYPLQIEAMKIKGPSFLPAFNAVRQAINSLYADVLNKSIQKAPMRAEPVATLIYGAPGIGKSFFQSELAKALISLERGINKQNVDSVKDIYYKKPETGTDQYIPGYSNQLVFIMDDLGAVVDSQANPNLDYVHIMGMVGTSPYCFPSASMAEKGKILYTSPYLILSSNIAFHVPPSLHCAEALNRRFHYKVFLVLKESHKTAQNRICMEKFESSGPGEFPWDIYVFSDGEIIPKYDAVGLQLNDERKMSMVDFVNMVYQKRKIHEALFAKFKDCKFACFPEDYNQIPYDQLPVLERELRAKVEGADSIERAEMIQRKKLEELRRNENKQRFVNNMRKKYSWANNIPKDQGADDPEEVEAAIEKVAEVTGETTTKVYHDAPEAFPKEHQLPCNVVLDEAGQLRKIRELRVKHLVEKFSPLYDANGERIHPDPDMEPPEKEAPPEPCARSWPSEYRQVCSQVDAVKVLPYRKSGHLQMVEFGRVHMLMDMVPDEDTMGSSAFMRHFDPNIVYAENLVKYIDTKLTDFQMSDLKSHIGDNKIFSEYLRFQTCRMILLSMVEIINRDPRSGYSQYFNKKISPGMFAVKFHRGASRLTETQERVKDELRRIQMQAKLFWFKYERPIKIAGYASAYVIGMGLVSLCTFICGSMMIAAFAKQVVPDNQALAPYDAQPPSAKAKAQVIVRPAKQSTIDADFENIARKLKHNLFSMYLVKHKDATPFYVSNILGIKGKCFLFTMHDVERLKDMHEVIFVRDGRIFARTTNLDNLRVVPMVTPDGSYTDSCIIEFKHINDVTDIVDKFITEADLVGLRQLAVALLGSMPGIGAHDVPMNEMRTGFASVISYQHEKPDGEVITIPRSFRYNIPTVKGDCVKVLLAMNPSMRRKVLGHHTAGHNSMGYANIVTQEMIRATFPAINQSSLMSFDPDELVEKPNKMWIYEMASNYFAVEEENPLDGNVIPLGEVQCPSGPKESKIKHGPLYGRVQKQGRVLEPVRGIAKLSDPKEDLMLNSISKVLNPAPYLDHKKAQLALDTLFEKFLHDTSSYYPRRFLTPHEAFHGVEEDPYLKPMNRKTSCGWPEVMRIPKQSRGKEYYLGKGENRFTHPYLMDQMQKCVDDIAAQKRPVFVFQDCLKDELRPLEKVRKPRAFSIGNIVFTGLCRKYLLPFCAFIMKTRIGNGIAVGIDAHSEWHLLNEHLRVKGMECFDGDIGQFDGSISHNLVLMIGEKVIEFIKNIHEVDELDEQVVRVIFSSIANSVHVFRGKLVIWGHSEPSGNPLTAYINSIITIIYLAIAWQVLYEGTEFEHPIHFFEHCSFVTYGDDHVVNVDPTVAPFYNQQGVMQALATMGINYTTAEKDDKFYKTKKLEECTFLKRHCGGNTTYGKLQEDLIWDMILWTKKGKSDIETLVQTVEAACTEMALYGKAKYTEFVRELREASSDLKIDFGFKPYSYYLFNRGHCFYDAHEMF